MTDTLVFTEKQNYRICSWWKRAGQRCFSSSSSSSFFLPSVLLLLSSELPELVFMEECVFSSHSFLTYGIIGSSAFLESIIERYSVHLYSARELQIRTSFQSHRKPKLGGDCNRETWQMPPYPAVQKLRLHLHAGYSTVEMTFLFVPPFQ